MTMILLSTLRRPAISSAITRVMVSADGAHVARDVGVIARRWETTYANTTNNHKPSISSSISQELIVDQSSFITTLTLNRPKQANALGANLMQEFQQALEDLEQQTASSTTQQQQQRCVVLTSSHPKVFCAGADLKERQQITCVSQVQDLVTGLRSTFHRVSRLPMPTIAVVEGVAVGGGLELALAADIIICSETATFGLPETSLGIIPGAGGTQRLPRRIGMARAMELVTTGRRIDGTTAYEYGLAQHVVPVGMAYEKAMELAQQIAKNAPIAVRAAKEAIQRGMDETTCWEDALNVEKECYAWTLPTQDRLEGLAAFKEGRAPDYKGQ